MRILVLCSILLPMLFISLLPMTGQAEITRAVIAVDGMSSPFCVFGVEKLQVFAPAAKQRKK